jgi:menaquinone C8-methyltransferase
MNNSSKPTSDRTFQHTNPKPKFGNHSTLKDRFTILAERLLTTFLKSQTNRLLTLRPSSTHSLPNSKPGHTYTLYIHVPFCESLCPYCSFNRFVFQKEKSLPYFQALREEMRMVAALGYQFKSLYIGGGTPTIQIDELVETIDLAKSLFDIQEVSCETNPNHLSPEIIQKLNGRVQRLSVGVQSFDNGLLHEMNRFEKFGGGDQILDRIKQAAPHFESLNVDMIFNFPNQTLEILTDDLQRVINSGAQQVTFYPLMSSNSVKRSMVNSIGKLTYSREWKFFNLINDRLANDFKQLSSWTYVRKSAGMIDEYIVDSDEYVGIGSGSFSYLDGTIYVNSFSIKEYSQKISQGQSPVTAFQPFSKFAQMRYWFMMKLFGLSLDAGAFKHKFGQSLTTGLFIEMLFMRLIGAFSGFNNYSLTRTGQYMSVVMMREFFSGVNNVRDIARKSLSSEELENATPGKNPGVYTYCKTQLNK